MAGLTKYVLLACAFFLLGADKQPTKQERERSEVERAGVYLPLEVDFTVHWEKCGSKNAAYYFKSHRIVMCAELLHGVLGSVPLARGVLLHELGHAITFQHGISFDRWEGNYEAAADEFASIMALAKGNPEDLDALATWFEWMAALYVTHPPHAVRAERFRCMLSGSATGAPTRCRAIYLDALRYWHVVFYEYGMEEAVWGLKR